jgi:outer membrane lipoprotein SlyB
MIRIAILAVTLGLLGACTGMNNTEQGAVSGGAIGAAGGAIVGAAAGNPVAGAVVGGVAGAAVGGAIGNQQDQAQSH